MKQPSRTKKFFRTSPLGYLIPMLLFGLFFTLHSFNQPLHDFANNYFPALLAVENIQPESILFDIYDFNQYAWSKGYDNVLTDFYINSPFIATLFYPFALIKNAFYSKLVFNIISVLLFTVTLYLISKKYLNEQQQKLILFIPILFFVPLRNNIEFGQVYLLILSFILLGYYFLDTNRKAAGGVLLSLSILTKVFPIYYCIPLIFNKKWKSIIIVFISTCLLLLISIFVGGLSFWTTYLFDVIPNAILNESTVNFQSNSQAFTVFIKTLFVEDAYHNPNALFNNPFVYAVITLVYSSLFIALAISASFKFKNQPFRLLSIWVITLFLIQSRTATYAQILWLIPAFEILRSEISNRIKVGLFLLLFLICNFPFHWLIGLPIVFEFSRMWFSMILGILFLYYFKVRLNRTFAIAFLLLFIPLLVPKILKEPKLENSEYALAKKEHFVIHDFYKQNNYLVYEALGKNGNEIIKTNIPIHSFDSTSCTLIDGQIYLNKEQLTDDYSLKKRPILINNKNIYYLTDQNSRRGAYTLKKITLDR